MEKLFDKKEAKVTIRFAPRVISGWPQVVLLLAGVYNCLFGLWVGLFPEQYFTMSGMEVPRYLALWQGMGMIIGLFGIGYLIASTDVYRHWPIVLVGLLGKVIGPLGFVYSASVGQFDWQGMWILLTNDLIWWVPFILILAKVHAAALLEGKLSEQQKKALLAYEGIRKASFKKPVLLVFLRHAGCAFAKEWESQFARQVVGSKLENAEVHFVKMKGPAVDISDTQTIIDSSQALYQLFRLKRFHFLEAFGLQSWIRGVEVLLSKACSIGPLAGDGFQSAGVILVENGEIRHQQRTENAAERLNLSPLLGSSLA